MVAALARVDYFRIVCVEHHAETMFLRNRVTTASTAPRRLPLGISSLFLERCFFLSDNGASSLPYMIIDCHGHYTTAPKALEDYRKSQILGLSDTSHVPVKGPVHITDDQIRESLEGAQLKLQRERGTDVTIFSPRASVMGHHVGNAATSLHWSELCNELIHRVCTLYPDNFVGVCQLPQSPGVPLDNCIAELER